MILVEAGPLVALVDGSDRHHRRCEAALRALAEPMATVWPVVAEAMARLAALPRGQDAVLEMIERGTLRILDLAVDDVPRMRELRRKGQRRVGLAELSLLRVAEREGIAGIFTLD